MKKIYYIFLTILFSIISVYLTGIIILSCFYIPDNIEETSIFRRNNISQQAIRQAFSEAHENKCDVSEVITVNYLMNDYNLNKIKLSTKEFQEIKKKYRTLYPKQYSNSLKAMAAIYDDIKYFPVAKGNQSVEWVSFDNSYGADRNYNGKYQHEGIDIMADNNVSGYFPIVSVTDGVIENMGWLEKGGYRVGVRSNSGGYFYYAHLSSYANIKKGDKIKAGTLLGYMGDTGYGKVEGTSGNFDVHLHFGIYIKTEHYEELSVNPYYVLKYLEDYLLIANY